MWEWEGECQVDIVDGDNAAEIAGGQRGLMMMLLASEWASERASERANRASCSWTGTPLYSPLHPLPPIRRSLSPRRSFCHFPLPPLRALPPHYPSFSNWYSDIACGVVPLPLSRHLHLRISHHRPLSPLNGKHFSPWSVIHTLDASNVFVSKIVEMDDKYLLGNN